MHTKKERGISVNSCDRFAKRKYEKFKFMFKFKFSRLQFPVILLLSVLFINKMYAGSGSGNLYFGKNISEAYKSIKELTPPPFEDSLSSSMLLPAPEPKLLPKRMSFMEKFLWGENGEVRKIGLLPELTPKERIHELHIRRTMLTAHQIGGFTTLALMLSAAYFGQRVIDGNRHMGDIHQILVTATMISYGVTGLLAILSPPPLIRRNEGGTVVIHKTLAWIHFAGMIITPILGSMIGGRRHFNINKAHFHQIAGYITTAVFTASVLVITF